MRLFILKKRSGVPAFFGKLAIGRPFAAQTIGPVIFIPGRLVPLSVLRHELRHVAQWYAFVVAGLGVALLTRSLAWLLLAPFLFPIAYALASLVAWVQGEHPYRANAFERDARRHAGEAV